ncbi:uncharacterized protein LOC124956830 [Vespa velutina]|uniref:uncharacterized protein LOC124956830 n=1 Tax=Vespa velutina TaxID=202808 RepID=UPI001FB2842A|nr:uncharacterized protein LOC124956830 [Vespa velutina]
MFLYYIVVLFLYWPNARGATDNVVSQDENIYDQIATASENIRTIVKTVPPPIDTSIHYENSNGFIPMTPANVVTSKYQQGNEFIQSTTFDPINVFDDQKENSTISTVLIHKYNGNLLKNIEKLENDLVESPEARIFLDLPHSGTNRRSFEFQDDQNIFELLKVHNDTPAVANYNDFYDNIEDLGDNDRRKRIGSYATNYDTVNEQSANAEEDVYGHYHSYDATEDEKGTSQMPEKVTSNYHQRNTVNYNGHGQSTTRQKITETSATSSRTNYEDNESNRKNGNNYDSLASSLNVSKNRHKFTKPVVVVEPNHYQIELNIDKQSSNSPSTPSTENHFKDSDSVAAESSNMYGRYHQEARGRSYIRDDSNDDSNDSMDYMDYTEKPMRVHKTKRRPYNVGTSRRLPKEHRTMIEDSMESENYKKRPSSTRLRSHRQRPQSTTWTNDNKNRNEDDSNEEKVHEPRMHVSSSQIKQQKSQQQLKTRPNSGWSQLGPNIEISHSNGIEISPIEKSNLVIPVGLMSIANFDHATALGNSQGFDVSNVLYQNIVTPTPIGTINTATTPIIGSHQSTVGQNVVATSNVPKTLTNLPNIQNIGISTPIPDIIVGQNSYQNPTHTMLVPQANLPNKISTNSNAQYVSSTITPIFALTTRLTPTLQSLRVQNIPNNVTPRPGFATTTPSSNLQQITVNQMQQGISHLIVPQPTVQTLSNLLQAPTQTNTEYNIQVNPHGLQGQNVISQGSFQIPNYPIHTATTPSPQFQPVTRVNIITADTPNKKTFIPASGGNILASASFTVGQSSQVQSPNDNNYAPQINLRPIYQDNSYRVMKDDNNMPKTKTYLQTANLIPFYHPVPPMSATTLNQQASQSVNNMNFLLPRLQEQNAQYQNVLHQLQLQLQHGQTLRNNKFPNYPYQTSDTVGSHTISNLNMVTVPQNNNFPHLPKVGAKNVEILNPNIKPSPIDTTIIHPLPTLHYPIITTPIPILTTTPEYSLSTPTPSYIDSLTDTRANQQGSSTMDMKTSQNQEKPFFNPINFVPNIDVIKNQNALNSKLQNHETLQQPLNLVPLIPDGNFFKPSLAAQSELLTKPKLSTDLEKYAEEMFKESLRTIYNSQKWNNDRKVQPTNNQTHVEPNDIVTLKNELMKLKATLPTDVKQTKEILEPYQSENKIRTTEPAKLTSPGNDKKKPDSLLATLEELLKAQSSLEPTYTRHEHRHKHSRKRPYSSNMKHLRDFLTPPKPSTHHSNSHYHDKVSKKRPSSSPSRYSHYTHSHFDGPRHTKKNGLNSKSISPEASASNIDGVRVIGRPSYPDFKKIPSIDDYPTFTTSAPNVDDIQKFIKELKSSSSTESNKYDINHPRMHNLLALLMKNKQLPSGNIKPNYFRTSDQLRQFFEDEKRRLQEQFYNDTLKSYLEKNTDNVSRMMPRSSVISADKVYANPAA